MWIPLTCSPKFQLQNLSQDFARISRRQGSPGGHSVQVVWVWVMSISFSERPMCPACKHRMGLARIVSGKRGFGEGAFEGGTCHRPPKSSFPADALETDRP